MENNHKKTALLVVDMINDYLAPRGKKYCEPCRSIIPNIRRLTGIARGKDWPVIFIGTSLESERETLVSKWGMHARKGTWGAEVIPELKPLAEDFQVGKTVYDGFYKTDLDALLKRLKIETVIVTGIHTHVCVLLTALGAFYRGYKVITVKEGMTTDKSIHHDTRLPFFETHVGQLLDLEEFAERFIQSGIPEYALLERKNLCIHDDTEMEKKSIFCQHCGTVIRNIDKNQEKIKCPQCRKEIWLDK